MFPAAVARSSGKGGGWSRCLVSATRPATLTEVLLKDPEDRTVLLSYSTEHLQLCTLPSVHSLSGRSWMGAEDTLVDSGQLTRLRSELAVYCMDPWTSFSLI